MSDSILLRIRSVTVRLVEDTLQAWQSGREAAAFPAELEKVVGEFLGLDQDVAIYRYFRWHYGHFFPRLRRVVRTTIGVCASPPNI